MIGDADGVCPEHAVDMCRLLPTSRLAVLPSDHGPYLGEMTAAKQDSKLPPLVVSIVEEFLDAPMPAGEPQMSSHTPKDWPRQFTQHLNAGNLEAVVALYDPDARFVARSGDTVVGRDRIRDVLAGLIDTHTRLQSRVIKAVTVGEVALLSTDFQGTTVDASGTTVDMRHKAIEVLRRQPDGTWKLIVGDPNGRE
jgi:uncharacterized protein (TIGR02246 family)